MLACVGDENFLMIITGWGRIVNISSLMGIVSVPKKSVYSAAKSGLNGLTRVMFILIGSFVIITHVFLCSRAVLYMKVCVTCWQGVALDLARDRITCNAVCPGFARAPGELLFATTTKQQKTMH